jgi:hypothetical protein
MNSTLMKTRLSFNEGIVHIRFVENAVVEVEDVIYIYCYAEQASKGKPYGVMFDSSSRHEFTEDAIEHFTSSAYIENIIAMAYISKDLISKIRLSLLLIFERPPLKPKMFSDEDQGYKWLEEQVKNYKLSFQ